MPFEIHAADDAGKTRLPFGQYKGRAFDEVPARYLDWLVGQDWVKRQSPGLYIDLAAYLDRPSIQRELAEELAE